MPRRHGATCTTPGCTARPDRDGKCARHARAHDTGRRRSIGTKHREPADRARRAASVAAHRARYGNWCPGYQRPPHHARDLTADHHTAIATGGDPHGGLRVLCRSCNSRKATR